MQKVYRLIIIGVLMSALGSLGLTRTCAGGAALFKSCTVLL